MKKRIMIFGLITILMTLLGGIVLGIVYNNKFDAVTAYKDNIVNNNNLSADVGSTIILDSDKICVIYEVRIVDGKEVVSESCIIQFSYLLNGEKIRDVVEVPATTTKTEDYKKIKELVKARLVPILPDPSTQYLVYASAGEKIII